MSSDRFAQHGERGRLVALEDVLRLGKYASHYSVEGHLYEFDQGRLWRTDLHAAGRQRVPIEDGPETPLGPWYHHTLCDCELCGGVETAAGS